MLLMMRRREFLPLLMQLGKKRPNILLLFSDDQRFDTIHALGNTAVKTPNLDRLAARGTTFTHAHIMGGTIPAVCSPSRAMLATGQTLFHVTDSIVIPKPNARPFDMFPEVLRKNGYTTFHTGKWHNGEKLHARCFSTAANIFFGGMDDHTSTMVAPFDPDGKYPKEKRQRAKTFSSELFSDSAIAFLKNQKPGDPFLAYIAYTAPHDPRIAPQKFRDMYPPESIAIPENFLPEHPFDNGELKVRDEALAPWPRTKERIRKEISDYYAMITHLDLHIGRVLDVLDASGHADNTIVIFASDNGLAVGRHGLLGKQNLYEHSIRVPLIIGGPELPANRKSDALVYLFDLFPTICDLTGLPIPASVEGKSLAPILRGQKTSVRDSVFYAYRNFQRGVRKDQWKMIRYQVNGVETTQLFDLQTDPWETHDLSKREGNAGKIKELTTLMKDWMKKTGDPADLDKPRWGI
jgi:arylsulfatase A-like enzyme